MKKLLFALSLLGLTAFAAAPSAQARDYDYHGNYRHHGYYGHGHGGYYGHPGYRHRYRHYRWSHGRRIYFYSYDPYGYYGEPAYYGPSYYTPGVNVHIGL